jgi:predicted HicB family RNase H-like nuclease
MDRELHSAAAKEAASRGITFTALVEAGLKNEVGKK